MNDSAPVSGLSKAPLYRQLLAMLYDGILVLALLFFTMLLLMLILPQPYAQQGHPLVSLILIGVIGFFFIWFWTHGGQTLGMRAWRIKLIQVDGKAVTLQQAFLRLLLALPAWVLIIYSEVAVSIHTNLPFEEMTARSLLIVGIILLFYDHTPNNWRDRLSKTQLILIPKA